MKMIDVPCSVSDRTTPKSSLVSWGVSTAVGSSSTSSRALR